MILSIVALVVFSAFNAKAQTITTVAGNGTSSGISGDGGLATNASINGANGGAFDKHGNYYVADVLGHRLRKVSPDGIITTVAGTGTAGYNGDGIQATAARLDNPTAVVIDSSGNIIIDDGNNYRIRRVSSSTGKISTIAGTGTSGYNGDNIPATNAQLGGVQDICLDISGNLYLADQVNFRVRKINAAGIITSIAGDGTFSGTGPTADGPATSCGFNFLSAVTSDEASNIFIGDRSAARVWRVNTSGTISVVAGDGSFTYIGDNVPATATGIIPSRLTVNKLGELVIADRASLRIFKIDTTGIIHNIAGNGSTGYSGDGGPSTAASLDFPAGVVYDTCDNLYIAESTNRRVRKVTFSATCHDETSKVKGANIESAISLYPNPATTHLTVKTSEKINTISLTNLFGQTIPITESTITNNKAEMNIAHLPPGMYLMRVNEVYVQRFMKE